MKTNHSIKGQHGINMFINFDNNQSSCYLFGNYEILKSMLIVTAEEHPIFAKILIDAALEFTQDKSNQQ